MSGISFTSIYTSSKSRIFGIVGFKTQRNSTQFVWNKVLKKMVGNKFFSWEYFKSYRNFLSNYLLYYRNNVLDMIKKSRLLALQRSKIFLLPA